MSIRKEQLRSTYWPRLNKWRLLPFLLDATSKLKYVVRWPGYHLAQPPFALLFIELEAMHSSLVAAAQSVRREIYSGQQI